MSARDWTAIYKSLDEEAEVMSCGERYTLLEELGRGSAKIIHRALDNHSGREVAYARPLDEARMRRELFFRELFTAIKMTTTWTCMTQTSRL